MPIRTRTEPTTAPNTAPPAGLSVESEPAPGRDQFELDITIIESGPEADQLIRMTDDGCGSTCQSACSTTCP
ncbi:FxLD family lanthipeptide [Actinomadura sp. 9N215]|uniref:FxLD family lanthipeptide n=1 Tax=Actinomadura sp. 9N215 TaxID=3375150 RepID=UPI0037ADD283